jgi:hypothetical protein
MCEDVDGTKLVIKGEEDNMIPRNQPATNNQGNSQRGGARRKGSGLRYLTSDMLSDAHQLASIIDARVQPDSFRPGTEAVVVKLKFRGEFILWTLRQGNPNLEAVGDAFGDDETSWKDRELELYVETDDFDGKKWIRCEPITKKTATTKR